MGKGIHRFLDLSIGHLPAKDRIQLDSIIDLSSMPSRTIEHDYGWFIWIPSDINRFEKNLKENFEVSDALTNIIKYAYKHGCWLINLDCDAEQVDELEYFDE